HTFEECPYGSRMAWRLSNRCIGRLFWSKMHISDAREVNDEEGVYHELIHHIKYATKYGKVKPTKRSFKQYEG
ncbi:nitric oxide synthase oxygenase, partial [Lysinibacillus sp. D4A1_S13]|uniref:nitric oxide synthase oxygenase n=1 Tax=Lysinibacillus sp. D4A1_S13 TaxID=2941228 RepID=UPI0020BEFF1A